MTDATRADADRFDNERVDVVGPRNEDDDLLDRDRLDRDGDETTPDEPATDETRHDTAFGDPATHDTAMDGTAMDDTAAHDPAGHDTAMHDTAAHDTAHDTALRGTDDVDDERDVDGRDMNARHALDDDTAVDTDTTAGTAPGRTDTGVMTPNTAATTTGSTATPTPAAATPGGADLLPANDIDGYQTEWHTVQSGFVDDPAGAVRDADALVGRLVDTITNRIAEQRSALSAQRSDDASEHTEQLRMALRDYRTMFQQLLPTQRS